MGDRDVGDRPGDICLVDLSLSVVGRLSTGREDVSMEGIWDSLTRS